MHLTPARLFLFIFCTKLILFTQSTQFCLSPKSMIFAICDTKTARFTIKYDSAYQQSSLIWAYITKITLLIKRLRGAMQRREKEKSNIFINNNPKKFIRLCALLISNDRH